MNLVGKILVVLVLIMSICFMAFAVAVYATHKNWQETLTLKTPIGNQKLGLILSAQGRKGRQRKTATEAHSAPTGSRRRKGRSPESYCRTEIQEGNV